MQAFQCNIENKCFFIQLGGSIYAFHLYSYNNQSFCDKKNDENVSCQVSTIGIPASETSSGAPNDLAYDLEENLFAEFLRGA